MSASGILLVVVGSVATAAVLVVALSWLIALLWCAPKRRLPTKGPADYGLRYETISFRSNDVVIRGWFIPSASGPDPAPTIILLHGWSRNAGDMLPAARVLHTAGFAVALYDARGHGLSGKDGPITILKFAQDVRACLDYLGTRADVDLGRIGLLGHSLGGSAALLVGSDDPRVHALVSCSAFSDPRTITEDFLRRAHVPVWPFLKLVCRHIEHWMGTSMEAVAPQRRIGQIRVPLLLLHGESDRFIAPAHMETLYAMANHDRTDIRNLPRRRHADVTTDALCGEEIVAFFVNHLSATPPARGEPSRHALAIGAK